MGTRRGGGADCFDDGKESRRSGAGRCNCVSARPRPREKGAKRGRWGSRRVKGGILDSLAIKYCSVGTYFMKIDDSTKWWEADPPRGMEN